MASVETIALRSRVSGRSLLIDLPILGSDGKRCRYNPLLNRYWRSSHLFCQFSSRRDPNLNVLVGPINGPWFPSTILFFTLDDNFIRAREPQDLKAIDTSHI